MFPADLLYTNIWFVSHYEGPDKSNIQGDP